MTMAADHLTAVVLNWRTPELTERAARALIDDGVPPERVVVVDNGSGDGSPERLGAALPGCRLLALPDNIGFARAINAGARELPARGAYLLVNSDAFVQRPGSVGALLETMQDDPACGAAVPRLRNEDGTVQPSVYPLSTPLPEAVRGLGLSRVVPDRLAPALGAHWSHAQSRRIQSAVGAVMLLRAAAWRQLDGLDESHDMYAEDLDLFWRLWRRGWHTRFVAGAEFTHLGGGSSRLRWEDPDRAARVAAAEAAMLRRQLPRWRAAATISLMAGGVGARAVARRLLGHREAADTLAAWRRGYLSRPARRPARRG
jgi:N-acetylglucosaminyl-diphospho-decaprenol L-rhamnosyltransferase